MEIHAYRKGEVTGLEAIQREILSVLLGVLREKGVIGEAVWSKAVAAVQSEKDLPAFFGDPTGCGKEGSMDGCSKDQE